MSFAMEMFGSGFLMPDDWGSGPGIYLLSIIYLNMHTCQVTLDISGSPFDFQRGSQKYPR